LRSTYHLRHIEQSFEVRFSYPVIFTRGALAPENPALREVLARAGERRHKLLTVLDAGLLQADPSIVDRLRAYAARHRDRMELVAPPLVQRGGEICKSEPLEVDELHTLVERHHVCRHSFVLAIGGGSVLDAAGFAATTAHRGVRLIRMPSTALAQNDAGIGVKNALNYHRRKNFLGTFAPPFAVVNDLERLASFEPDAMEHMVVRCAELHLHHLRASGDPFELGSARPLDFGHWSAHKLEEISGNELRHGEAVAIGIAVDALYSQQMGMIGEQDLFDILTTLETIGYDLHHSSLRRLDVDTALSEFREHLGGDLSITLLCGIGRGVEVGEIDRAVMNKCVSSLAQNVWNGLGKPAT
jgi:3-dehydroquinate synthase